MFIEKRIPLNIDVEKLLQGCENAHINSEQLAEYSARYEEQRARNIERSRRFRVEQREKWLAINRRYNAKRRVKHPRIRKSKSESSRAYRCKHHSEVLARLYAWRAANADLYNERHRIDCARYRERNREKINAHSREYYAAHRDEINAKRRARRAEQRAAKAAQQPPTE